MTPSLSRRAAILGGLGIAAGLGGFLLPQGFADEGAPSSGASPRTRTPSSKAPGDLVDIDQLLSPLPEGRLVPVLQASGQEGQWSDCGPASLVILLHAVGITPDAWDPANPAAAIEAVQGPGRMDIPSPTTDKGANGRQLNAGMKSYGLQALYVKTADQALRAARKGHPSILRGTTLVLPWAQNVVTASPHWLVLGGYDEATGEYLVVDPVCFGWNNVVHRATEEQVKAYMGTQQSAWVVLGVQPR